jgi:hypothetical protein
MGHDLAKGEISMSTMGVEGEEESRPGRPQYYFQIIAVPESEAPLEHLKPLVGKVFPLMPRNMDGREPTVALEIESGRRVLVEDGIGVELCDVVDVLRAAGEEEAADYWEARRFPSLVFQRSEVRIVLPHHVRED